MAKAIGQPTPWTHSHLMDPSEIISGIKTEEFIARRAAFTQTIPVGNIAIIPAYRIRYPWQQNPNLYYLCGFDEPNGALVLERRPTGTKWTLFHEGNDEHSLLWSGPRADEAAIKNFFHLDAAEPFKQIGEFIKSCSNEKILVDWNENSCLNEIDQQVLNQSGSSPLRYTLDRLRLVKSTAEQGIMRKTAQWAADAFSQVLRQAPSLKNENQLAALMEYECRRRGASGLAYVPVVAGGDRANIIHYVRNDRQVENEQLVLMDAGAKYNGYCSDITRTFPVSGKWSPAQLELYLAVWRVQQRCIELIRNRREVGELTLNILHSVATHLLVEELGRLGISRPEQQVHQLFPHSIGHYLGLDLHDCQTISYDETLAPGMIITIEPGLYIPFDSSGIPTRYWGIGIRVEDDILITKDGCEILSKDVPSDPIAIEQLMNRLS